MSFIPIVVAVVALGGVIFYINYLAEKKRTEAMRREAEELGFDFTAADRAKLFNRLLEFHLCSQGHGKRIYNVLRGESNDLRVTIFDYRYTTGGGKHGHTSNQTVVCFQMKGPGLPSFFLRPETFLDRIGGLFGFQDIDFDEHPVFSKKYLLRGRDAPAIRESFTEEVLTFYESVAGVSTEANGNRLLYYRHGKRVKPLEIREFLEEGFKALAVFRPSTKTSS
jgi:hypothetical protein